MYVFFLVILLSFEEYPTDLVNNLKSSGVIIREPIDKIASKYPAVRLMSVCDRLSRWHELDWSNLFLMKNLTHFSIHEHFRTKSMMPEYLETVLEIIQDWDEKIRGFK